MKQLLSLLSVITMLACSMSFAEDEAPAAAKKSLSIGSSAPPIDIEHWISTAGGKFAPVTEFEPGKVYVVEFWATWCGPCKKGMPHLAEMQEHFADRGVMVIGVSNEDLETVNTFLEGAAPRPESAAVEGEGDEPTSQTYGELTSAYCLATDPDGSTMNDYFRAAGQTGIPCAFIVGKDGKIEWVGHPAKMDSVLEQVVSDGWDRESFAVEFNIVQLEKKLNAAADAAIKEGDPEKMAGLVEKFKQLDLGDEYAPAVEKAIAKVESVLEATALSSDPEAALAKVESHSLNHRQLSMLSSQLTKDANNGGTPSPALALAVAQQLETDLGDTSSMKGIVAIQGLSRLTQVANLYFLAGETDKAIELCQDAIVGYDALAVELAAKAAAQGKSNGPNPLIKMFRRGATGSLKRFEEAKAASESKAPTPDAGA